jgi:hypothetical protein
MIINNTKGDTPSKKEKAGVIGGDVNGWKEGKFHGLIQNHKCSTIESPSDNYAH